MTRRRSPHLPLRPRLRSPLARRQLRCAAGLDGALVGARHDRLHHAPTRNPRLDVYVPIVDWGVRAPYGLPRHRGAHARPRHGRRRGPLRQAGRGEHPAPSQRAERGRRARSHARASRRSSEESSAGSWQELSWPPSGAADTGSPRSGDRPATSLACVAFFAVSLTHLDPRSFRELEFYAHGEERGCSPSRRKCSKPERRTRTPTTAHSTA